MLDVRCGSRPLELFTGPKKPVLFLQLQQDAEGDAVVAEAAGGAERKRGSLGEKPCGKAATMSRCANQRSAWSSQLAVFMLHTCAAWALTVLQQSAEMTGLNETAVWTQQMLEGSSWHETGCESP